MTSSNYNEGPIDLLHRTMQQVEDALDSPTRIAAARRTLERPVPPLVVVLIRTLAADLNVPFAAATVLDEKYQHFLASSADIEACDREDSHCQYVIGTGRMLAINNTKEHSFWKRAWRLAIPGGENLQAYLGVPLKDEAGEILGSVCVVDIKPRVWTAEEHYALYETSTLITRLISEPVES